MPGYRLSLQGGHSGKRLQQPLTAHLLSKAMRIVTLACLCAAQFAHCLLCLGPPAHGMGLLTWASLPSSMNTIRTIPHRHSHEPAQRWGKRLEKPWKPGLQISLWMCADTNKVEAGVTAAAWLLTSVCMPGIHSGTHTCEHVCMHTHTHCKHARFKRAGHLLLAVRDAIWLFAALFFFEVEFVG